MQHNHVDFFYSVHSSSLSKPSADITHNAPRPESQCVILAAANLASRPRRGAGLPDLTDFELPVLVFRCNQLPSVEAITFSYTIVFYHLPQDL